MSTSSISSYSPQAPDELVGEFPCATEQDVAQALAGAREAQREWSAAGAAARAKALAEAGADLAERREQAVALIVREVGKPLAEARGEVARAIAILEYYAQASFARRGDHFPPSGAGLLYTERRPWGVAGLITPWNFPLAIPLWKAAPALTAGNAVALKPSPEAAGCAELLGEVLAAHLPAGLFTVLQGEAETGAALLERADVISFTGSAAVGALVAAGAGRRGVPVQCEMGGQNAAIVLADADPAASAAMIAGAAMGYAGQKCTATRRIIVVGPNEAFLDALAAAVESLAPGAPEDGATVVGPVINELALGKLEAAFAAASSSGGKILAGGRAAGERGWFAEPTLVAGLDGAHPLAQQETFGPLALILQAPDIDAAVALANGVAFGLVTSVHGRDIDSLLEVVAGADTGMIKVNAPTTGVDFYAPFGGEKASSYGPREQGPAALEFYSSTRTITIAPHGG